MATAQTNDPELKEYLVSTFSSLDLKPVPLPFSDSTIICDVSNGMPRPFVPTPFCRKVFDVLHGLSHPDIQASHKLIAGRYVWPCMYRDIKNWTCTCVACQSSKIQHHTVAPLSSFSTPDNRFSKLHLDLVSPLPVSQGYTYLLTIIDRFTWWPEAAPLREITAEEVAKAFIANWISRFGIPATVTTDQGCQFESILWADLFKIIGVHRIRTIAYHPIANGLVERFHRQLKSALKVLPSSVHCVDALPLILLGIRTTLKEDIGCTAAELVYGTVLRIPGQILSSSVLKSTDDPSNFVTSLRTVMNSLQAVPPRSQERKSYIKSALSTCTHVFIRYDGVRSSLQRPYNGPYRVIKRQKKHFTVNVNGQHKVISLDRLKPAYLSLPGNFNSSTVNSPNTNNNNDPSGSSNSNSKDNSSSSVNSHPPLVTRSGRQVYFPTCLDL